MPLSLSASMAATLAIQSARFEHRFDAGKIREVIAGAGLGSSIRIFDALTGTLLHRSHPQPYPCSSLNRKGAEDAEDKSGVGERPTSFSASATHPESEMPLTGCEVEQTIAFPLATPGAPKLTERVPFPLP